MRRCFIFFLSVLLTQATAQEKTRFGPDTGVYSKMLDDLERMMFRDVEMKVDTLGGKQRTIFVPWIRDHVHVMKAMKFLHPDMTSFIEFYLENQTPEGIYFDYYYPLANNGIGARRKIFDQRYWKIFPDEKIEMHRLPVEADLEYLLVEGVYAVWQSTGDIAFVKKWLPSLVRGMQYSMTDPLRWSDKYQLVKRGYTLDTWDFMQLPASREEYIRSGGDVQKGIFNIDEHTPMGIMHGDNSGMYAACNQLSVMFREAGDQSEAAAWKAKAARFRERTNTLCWNGKFYAHFIEDDPQPAYLKMDQRNTLSLSNPYDINRGLPTQAMAQSIIQTYKTLKETNKANSFAEWYGIYPAVQPHFADYLPGSYMNGGVNTIVAGELAKAAFQHGFEAYGVDILRRIMQLIDQHDGKLPVAYTPAGKVDEGIPDNWGQAAVYSAMIEGLAGVVDNGTQFLDLEISPRWMAAGEDRASVTVAYGPTGSSIQYDYHHDAANKTISLTVQGKMSNGKVRLLLPPHVTTATAQVNGKAVPAPIEKVNGSFYIVAGGLKGFVKVEAKY
ncbi:MAG TPA: hypothetical protein VD816_08990 [Ohtaekwangia sp.]|nr:hypothetical protein [Ohtaekwangia sp.]